MNSARDTVKYDRNSNTISFKGTAIIDMSLVPETAKATFYSGVTIDFQGFDTVLKFDSTKMPFDLQVAAFNATGFIRAIVENRLEVEGMVVSNVIQKAYEYLRENDLLNKRSSSVGGGEVNKQILSDKVKTISTDNLFLPNNVNFPLLLNYESL